MAESPGKPAPLDPVDRLAGIGPKLRAALSEVGVERVVDLLLHLPLRYEDRTRALTVAAAREQLDRSVLVRGRFARLRARRGRNRRLAVVEAVLTDDTGMLPAVWFNQAWMGALLRGLDEVWVYGPVRRSPAGAPQIVNPEVEEAEAGVPVERIVPVYPRLGPLGGRRLRRLIGQALESLPGVEDPLPEVLRRELGLDCFAEALRSVHSPEPPVDPAQLEHLLERLAERATPGHRRLALDELLAFTCGVVEMGQRRARQRAPCCRLREPLPDLARRTLPFRLTVAQGRALAAIARDLEGPRPMARLLQGDVGCGKTAVAALAMAVVAGSGAQAALMAPTELLAEQHRRTLTALLAGTGWAPMLLSSSLPSAEQRGVRAALAAGELRLVVGTHALIQESVEFRRLGLVVIDEQHRFGVAQRQALVDKGEATHMLVMTATPIPRSLALTLYGDLELTVIDELPPGRQPVRTVIRPAAARPRLYAFLRQEVAEGGRVYVVCPLIEPSEQLAARALEEQVEQVRAALPGLTVGALHGRLAAAERDAVGRAFREGEIQVVVATTLIEVGVDVPEASVMVIESPERFGLSQLHQLRGRVGRGGRRSWCVLVVEEELSAEARRRLEVFCRVRDGFELAEADLALRGPGELAGTRQWGRSGFRFADLLRHRDLVELARDLAGRMAASGELPAVRAALGRYHRTAVELPAG